MLVIAFSDLSGANDVLHKLRELEKIDHLDIENACVAERSAKGRLQLKQNVGDTTEDTLHPRFWRRLVGHLLRHGEDEMSDEGATPELGFSQKFAKQLSQQLTPGTSALFVLVDQASLEEVVEILQDYTGTILRSSLQPEEREVLSQALGPRSVRVPTADDLRLMANREALARYKRTKGGRTAANSEKEERLRRLRDERLT
ncbi:MAG: DUF1269 domain-containing protein [Okeania sp. SIO3C4]|nr:DUF1269 domain-containing protein [Okeania sp. SIO3C4]